MIDKALNWIGRHTSQKDHTTYLPPRQRWQWPRLQEGLWKRLHYHRNMECKNTCPNRETKRTHPRTGQVCLELSGPLWSQMEEVWRTSYQQWTYTVLQCWSWQTHQQRRLSCQQVHQKLSDRCCPVSSRLITICLGAALSTSGGTSLHTNIKSWRWKRKLHYTLGHHQQGQ